MSHNWNPVDFLRMMKSEYIKAKELQIGDVIWADYGFWQVARVIENDDGTFDYFDEDDNGTVNRDGEWQLCILKRSLFERITHY